MKKPIYLIAAADEKNGIGKKGRLPWHLPGDLAFFQRMTEHTDNPTKENLVIMGRKTWESIPESRRPLPGRHNVVISRQDSYFSPGAHVSPSLEKAIASADTAIETIFIIGGGKVFAEAIRHPDLIGLYLTRVKGAFDCDTFFPEIPERFKNAEVLGDGTDGETTYQFVKYTC